jgi:dihydrofolate reductase
MTSPQEALSSPDAAPEDRSRTPEQRIVLVAAVADNGVIGRDGDIPWRIPEDMKHFRAVTSGNTVVMGRRTYESIGRPLPHRTNIVVTRSPGWSAEGVTVACSVDEALAKARAATGDVMVIGGAQIYEAAIGAADVQVLTEVHRSPEGDTFYPAFDRSEWVETRREPHDGYAFVWLERR